MAESLDQTLADRGKTYGDFTDQAQVSLDLRNIVMGCWNQRGLEQPPAFVLEGMVMVLHKLARLTTGDLFHIDTWHDIAGYATLVEQRLIALALLAPPHDVAEKLHQYMKSQQEVPHDGTTRKQQDADRPWPDTQPTGPPDASCPGLGPRGPQDVSRPRPDARGITGSGSIRTGEPDPWCRCARIRIDSTQSPLRCRECGRLVPTGPGTF